MPCMPRPQPRSSATRLGICGDTTNRIASRSSSSIHWEVMSTPCDAVRPPRCSAFSPSVLKSDDDASVIEGIACRGPQTITPAGRDAYAEVGIETQPLGGNVGDRRRGCAEQRYRAVLPVAELA